MPDPYVPEVEAPPSRPAHAPPTAGTDARRGIEPPAREELERLRARDPEALRSFYRRYMDRIYGVVYRLVGERSLAEDVTQEVFLKVHRAADRLDPGRDPYPWLVTIAHNACRDVWRSSAYRMSRRAASIEADTVVAGSLTLGTNDPERDALGRERERFVQAAIARLPEPLRVAIVLHAYEGMSHEEIAAATGTNHAAARKRYSRALVALGRLLGDTLR
jgi:RNA polymerase sigma-70 factor (ECF subfamily)